MEKYAVVGSGSCGNSYIFKTAESGFVVDNGYSFSEFSRRIKSMDFDIRDIRYIFLTHNHKDHISGMEILSRKLQIPVFVAENLDLSGSLKEGFFRTIEVTPGNTYRVDDFTFTVFSTTHDAPCSVGYSFATSESRYTIITDTGKTSELMRSLADQSDVLFLEANYCPEMLKKGPYPYFLKKRIFSDHGHLSNHDAVDFIKKLDSGKKRSIYLCHISDKNNSPERVKEVFDSEFSGDLDYHICKRGIPVLGKRS